MKCPSPHHNGLAMAEYVGPTSSIAQTPFVETLEPYGVRMSGHREQTQQSHVPADQMHAWHGGYPELKTSGGRLRIGRAECLLGTLDGLVTIDLTGEIAQREPVARGGSMMRRESFAVNGCGPLVTAACVFVAKSVPWEQFALGGTTKLSTSYGGTNLPPMKQVTYTGARQRQTWQAVRPFGEKLVLNAPLNGGYNGREGSEFNGGLYFSGSMSEFPATALAQAKVLGHILGDNKQAERTVAHVYGGSPEALGEAWTRALSGETETPTEAAQLAHAILTR